MSIGRKAIMEKADFTKLSTWEHEGRVSNQSHSRLSGRSCFPGFVFDGPRPISGQADQSLAQMPRLRDKPLDTSGVERGSARILPFGRLSTSWAWFLLPCFRATNGGSNARPV